MTQCPCWRSTAVAFTSLILREKICINPICTKPRLRGCMIAALNWASLLLAIRGDEVPYLRTPVRQPRRMLACSWPGGRSALFGALRQGRRFFCFPRRLCCERARGPNTVNPPHELMPTSGLFAERITVRGRTKLFADVTQISLVACDQGIIAARRQNFQHFCAMRHCLRHRATGRAVGNPSRLRSAILSVIAVQHSKSFDRAHTRLIFG
jgi:hypothetical protein